MSVRVSIARVAVEDVHLVSPLFAAYREFYGKDNGDAARCGVFMRDRLTRGESVVFVARVPSGTTISDPGSPGLDVAGFAQLYPTFTSVGLARVWHLNDLFVAVRHRRLGVAKALVQHCVAFAKQDGAARLTLETQTHNASARALYEKLGFVLGTEFVKYAVKFG